MSMNWRQTVSSQTVCTNDSAQVTPAPLLDVPSVEDLEAHASRVPGRQGKLQIITREAPPVSCHERPDEAKETVKTAFWHLTWCMCSPTSGVN